MTPLQLLAKGTVIPAMPLALNAQRKLDERRQRALVRYYAACGVGGLAVGVHTTQFAIREPSVGLFAPVLELCADELRAQEKTTGRCFVKVAGACGPAGQAVAEAKLARSLGYDAVLLSPGGLGGLSEEQMLERTRAVADVLPVIGFYLQTAVGGRAFTERYWAELANIEGVVAVKAAPFNRYQTLELVRAVALSRRADRITLYTGNDDNIVVDLLTTYRFPKEDSIVEKGFVGGLLGHYAVWTYTAVRLFEELSAARASGRVTPEHLTLAAQVTHSNAAFFDAANGFAGCIAGIHEVLRRQGLLEGIWCIDTNEGLSPGQSAEIDRVMQLYPHLSDDAFVAEHLHDFLR